MRHSGRRLLALGAISAGALGLLGAAPAGALTIATPPTLGPIQLPVTGGISVEPGEPATVNVNGPDSAPLAGVTAGPSGVSVNVPAVPSLPIEATVGVPIPGVPVPPVGSLPVPGANPGVAGPAAPAESVANPPAPDGSATHGGSDPRSTASNPRSATTPSISQQAIRSTVRNDTNANVSGSITRGHGSGLLSALPSIDARIALWFALAALIGAIRWFVGSASSRATRAS